MQIETLDDILNELADLMGCYGCCKYAENGYGVCDEESTTCCRVGFMMVYHERIEKAIENEKALAKAGL